MAMPKHTVRAAGERQLKCISRRPLPEKLEDDAELLTLYTGDMLQLNGPDAQGQRSDLTGIMQIGALGAKACLLTAKWARNVLAVIAV